MNIIKAIVSSLFPNNCLGCGEVLDNDEYFCDYCYSNIERCVADKICRKCGLPKKNCQCHRRVFHFDACVAPFRNDGPARIAMHKFKFREKHHYGKFFAEQMAIMVKQVYADRHFDFITYVPMNTFQKLRRGYNQSYVLAYELSKILDIPIGINVLKCRRKAKTQHLLTEKERFLNVKGKYVCDVSLIGKSVLLVDDIKTTGATLDESAKQLMRSGADSVCCVTGLITYKDKKKDKDTKKVSKNNGN